MPPDRFRRLLDETQHEVRQRRAVYEQLAALKVPRRETTEDVRELPAVLATRGRES